MIDERTIVQHAAEQLTPPEPAFERLLRRRDRKRRNQRISAGIVGLAVFAAAIALVSVNAEERPDPSPRPASTGTPVVSPNPRIGLVGLPPKGMAPSLPAIGELVVGFGFGHTSGDPGRFHVNVYEDGRLIWERLGDPTQGTSSTGWIEQRLTPEGVEAMRSEVLATGLFERDVHFSNLYGLHSGDIKVRDGGRFVRVTWGDIGIHVAPQDPTAAQVSALERLDERFADPASWLPAGAWQDQEMRPFVPSRYSVCYGTETDDEVGLSDVLAPFPRPVRDLLLNYERRAEVLEKPDPFPMLYFWCSTLTTDQARGLEATFEDAGVDLKVTVFGLSFGRQGGSDDVFLDVWPVLPHDSPF